MNKRIYVAIPDIGDPELYPTVKNLFESANDRDRVFVGIGHSIPFKNKKNTDEINLKFKEFKNVKNEFINFYRNVGVSYGRHAALKNYNNEDFYLQIDSHTLFEKDWDIKLISYYEEAKNFFDSDKLLLTGFLSQYQYTSKTNKSFLTNNSKPGWAYYISGLEEKIKMSHLVKNHWEGIEIDGVNYGYSRIPMFMIMNSFIHEVFNISKNRYLKSRRMSANFIFSDNNIVKDYDKVLPINTHFFEEEYILSVELHDLGYTMAFPNFDIPLGHLYMDECNEYYMRPPKIEPTDNPMYKNLKKELNDYLDNNQDKIKKYAEYAGLSYPELHSIGCTYIPDIGCLNEEEFISIPERYSEISIVPRIG